MSLPLSQDPEGLPYSTKLLMNNGGSAAASSFITVLSNRLLRVFPRVCETDVGTHLITIKVEDEEPKAISYSFNVIVKNQPPIQYARILN